MTMTALTTCESMHKSIRKLFNKFNKSKINIIQKSSQFKVLKGKLLMKLLIKKVEKTW